MSETEGGERNTGAGGTTGSESGPTTGAGGTIGSDYTGAGFDAPATSVEGGEGNPVESVTGETREGSEPTR